MWWIKLKPSAGSTHTCTYFKNNKKENLVSRFFKTRKNKNIHRLWFHKFRYYVCMMTFGLWDQDYCTYLVHCTLCSSDAWKVCQLEQSSVTITEENFFVYSIHVCMIIISKLFIYKVRNFFNHHASDSGVKTWIFSNVAWNS